MFSVWLLQLDTMRHCIMKDEGKKKKKKRSKKLVAIKSGFPSFPLICCTSVTRPLQVMWSTQKISEKSCIYYHDEKPERLLKQEGIGEKHYFFHRLFFAPCLFTLHI